MTQKEQALRDALQASLDETQTLIEGVMPTLEGLEDYLRLNIRDDTRREVENVRDSYVDYINDLRNYHHVASATLALNEHPTLSVREISAAAYKDLADQIVTVTAAFKRFSSDVAVDLGLTAGGVEPKL